MTDTTKPSGVSKNFDDLMEAHRLILKDCFDALAPGKTQQERNTLRTALGNYLGVK